MAANGLGRLDSAAVERDPLSAFLEAEAAHRADLDQLKALQSDRDDALLSSGVTSLRCPPVSVTASGIPARGHRAGDASLGYVSWALKFASTRSTLTAV